MDDVQMKQESEVKKRPTAAVLSRALERGKYETAEEKELIVATLEGKNRDIVAIVKDDQLRRIWLSCFYQRSMMSKAALNKINLAEVTEKIEQIQHRLSMQHKATLLAGLGEILMKKYNLTQNEVKDLLQVILNPVEKPEEEEEQKRRRSQSPKRRRAGERAEPDPNRAISTYRLLDLTMLLLPQETMSSSLGGKSSVYSKMIEEPHSDDGVFIRPDDAYISEIDKPLSHFEESKSGENGSHVPSSIHQRRDLTPDQIDSIIGKTIRPDMSTDALRPIPDMDNYIEGPSPDFEPYGQIQMPKEDSDLHVGFNLESVEMKTPEIDLDIYQSILRAEEEKAGAKGAYIRKPRKLNDLLLVDEQMYIAEAPGRAAADSQKEEQNIENSLVANFKRYRSVLEKKRQEREVHAYDSAFYSTEDESGGEQGFVETIMRECQKLPLTIKKQLQVIKEEHEVEEHPDFDYQADMGGAFDQ